MWFSAAAWVRRFDRFIFRCWDAFSVKMAKLDQTNDHQMRRLFVALLPFYLLLGLIGFLLGRYGP